MECGGDRWMLGNRRKREGVTDIVKKDKKILKEENDMLHIKNLKKRITSLLVALVMVVGILPASPLALTASASESITLSGDTFTTSPGEGFIFSYIYFYCWGCHRRVYEDSDISGHSFEITSFSYTIANGTYSWKATAKATGCAGSSTATNNATFSFVCNNKEHVYYGTSFYVNGKKMGSFSITLDRTASSHQGDATCVTADICALCGTSYTNASNHEKPNEFTYSNNADSGNHNQLYACCGAVHTSGLEHNLSDWLTGDGKHWKKCTDCGAVLNEAEHSADAPTCLVAPTCETCGVAFQEKDPDNHETTETYYALIDDDTHGLYHSCCDAFIETGEHTPKNDPTCTGQSICSVCLGGYGEKNSDNHTGELEWVHEDYYHTQKWNCCDQIVVPRTWHTAQFNKTVYNDDGSASISATCSVCEKDLGTLTVTAPDGEVYDGEYHQIRTDGKVYCASGDNSLFVTYYNADDKMLNSYGIGNSKGGVNSGGTFTVIIHTFGGTKLAEMEFTIEPKPITISSVYVYDKAYDGTTEANAYSLTFDGAVEGDTLYAGIDGDVVFSDSVVGKYTTVKGITSARAFLSTIAARYGDNYVVVDVNPEKAYPIVGSAEISKRTLYITAENQTINEGGELDQTMYTVENLPDGYVLSGIKLEADDTTIDVDTSSATVTLDGEDVSNNFEFGTYSGILATVCEGHTFNEYGFCSTGKCLAYKVPEYELDEFNNKVYQISCAGELYWFAEQVNTYNKNDIYGVLVNDIEVPKSKSQEGGTIPDWTPIGSSTTRYCGAFDGQCYVISGLYCKSEGDYVGLFGGTGYNYSIQNIGLSDCYFEGNSKVGALVGYAESYISNCYADETVTVAGKTEVGGLVGYNASSIQNSYAAQSCVAAYSATSNGASVVNCYYLADTDDGDGGKTADQFASGEVAYLLNGSTSPPAEGESLVWYQTIGEDAYPNFTGLTVYQYENCKEEASYSNTKTADGTHIWEKGKCTICGGDCGHTLTYTESGDTITAKCSVCQGDLCVKLSASDKTYDGTEVTATATVTGEIGEGETPAISYAVKNGETLTEAPTNVGTYTASITMGEGEKAVTASTDFTISPKTLTVTGATAADRDYDGTNTVEIQAVTLDGLVTGDTVSAQLSGQGTLSSANAGTYTSVTLPEITLTGTGAGNYTLTQPTGEVALKNNTDTTKGVTIKKLDGTITVKENSYSKTYGDEAFGLDVEANHSEADIVYTVSDSKKANGTTVNDDAVITVENGTVTIKGAGEATIKVSLAETTNYNVAESKTITVNVAQKAATAIDTINRKYLYSRDNADSINLAELLPEDCGTVNYTISPTTGDIIYSEQPSVKDGVLSYTVKSGKADTEGSIKIVATTDNYEDITITIELALIDKLSVKLQDSTAEILQNDTLTYGDTLSTLQFNSVVFVDTNGNPVAGTLAWETPDDKPDAKTTGATWVFTPTDDLYDSLEGTVMIKVNKATPAVAEVPAASERTYHPSTALAGDDLTGGMVKGADGTSLTGTWSWQTEDIIPKVNNSGYVAVFTPADTTNYETVKETITVKVNKATPVIHTNATAITYGDILGKSALSGLAQYSDTDSTAVSGSFAWKDDSVKPAVADSNKTAYTVVFTPEDTVNYNTAETTVTLTVNKAENAPNMPGSTMSVPNSTKTVGAVTLPDGWAWNESNQTTELKAGVAVTATAVYTGSDKGNYENESVEITITRSSCDHTGGTATCSQKAVCTVCGDAYGNLDKTNHTGETEVRDGKKATCTETGYTGDTYCKDCDEKTATGTTIAALGHNYTNEVTKESTTTEEGVRTYTCTRCEDSYTEAIPKLPTESHEHIYTAQVTKEPTTTEPGVRTYTCSCGDSYTEVIPKLPTESHEHNYTAQVTKEPTATVPGVRTYTCSCGDSYTETIPATGDPVEPDCKHANTEVRDAKEATCTLEGYTGDTYCKDCDKKTATGTTIAALGHNYTGKVTKESTTTEEGVRTYTCSRCEDSYTEVIPKLPTESHEHNYTAQVTKEPTATEPGVRTYTCSCGDSYTETIPATGDSVEPECKHANTEVRDAKEATCTEAGYTGDTCCKDCDEKTATGTTIAALGHNYTSKVTKESTTTEEGVRTYTCTRCEDSYTEVIPKLPTEDHEHNYTAQVTKEPTATEPGVRTYKCSCGDSYTETIPATGDSVEPECKHANTEVRDAKEATCTEAGYTGDTCCKDCDEKTATGTTIAALGHNYTNEVTKEPTTTEDGVRTYNCTRCEDSYTEVIPKLPTEDHEHSYTAQVTKEPTATEPGVRTYTCSCGDSYTETIPATGENGSDQPGSGQTGSGQKEQVAEETQILSQENDNDIQGSTFGKLSLKMSKVTKTSIKLKWKKVKGAEGYIVYGAKCNSKGKIYKMEKLNDTTKTSFTHKKLKKGTYYKYVVRAYKVVDGVKTTVSTSKTLYITTSGGKYANYTSVKVPKTKVTIKKGKKYTIKAKAVLKKGKKSKTHRKLCYESSNTNIATVTSKGVIKAKKKGTCYVYVYAQNGVYKKIKVTVK